MNLQSILLTTLIAFILNFQANAQVGVNTSAPKAELDVKGQVENTFLLDINFSDDIDGVSTHGNPLWTVQNYLDSICFSSNNTTATQISEVNIDVNVPEARTAFLTFDLNVNLTANGFFDLNKQVYTSSENTDWTQITIPLDVGVNKIVMVLSGDNSANFPGKVAIDNVNAFYLDGFALRVDDGSQADGYVLTSDENGNATWEENRLKLLIDNDDDTYLEVLDANAVMATIKNNEILYIDGSNFHVDVTRFNIGTLRDSLGNMKWGLETQSTGNFGTVWGGYNIGTGDGATVWGNSNEVSGLNGTAWGSTTNVSGAYGTAWGRNSKATGEYSTVFGYRLFPTDTTEASGGGAVAWGINNKAAGLASTAFGWNNEVIGPFSLAFGSGNVVNGAYSNAGGFGNTQSGQKSTVFGNENIVDGDTLMVWGNKNMVQGNLSTSWGGENTTNGNNLTSWGKGNNVQGSGSTSWGNGNVVNASFSTAWGLSNSATGSYSTALGTENSVVGDYAMVMGGFNLSSNLYNFVWGSQNTTPTSSSSHQTVWGRGNLVFGFYSTVFGRSNIARGDTNTIWGANNEVIGNNGTSWGIGNTVSDDNSTSWGKNNTISGESSTVWGEGNTNSSNSNYSTIWGFNNRVENVLASAWGQLNQANGFLSTTWGYDNRVFGLHGTSWGEGNTTSGINATSWGLYNVVNASEATSWGGSNEATARLATIWGGSGKAAGEYSTVWGRFNEAGSELGTALGAFCRSRGGTSDAWVLTDPLVQIGNGVDEMNRNDALLILKNGNMGVDFGDGDGLPQYKLHVLGQIVGDNLAASSDSRIKKNQRELNYGLEEVRDLQPKAYNQYKYSFPGGGLETKGLGEASIGMIAQEVYEIIPEAVLVPEDENKDIWHLDYTKLVPVLIKAVQELDEEVREQKTKLTELEDENILLKKQLEKYASLEARINALEKVN